MPKIQLRVEQTVKSFLTFCFLTAFHRETSAVHFLTIHPLTVKRYKQVELLTLYIYLFWVNYLPNSETRIIMVRSLTRPRLTTPKLPSHPSYYKNSVAQQHFSACAIYLGTISVVTNINLAIVTPSIFPFLFCYCPCAEFELQCVS